MRLIRSSFAAVCIAACGPLPATAPASSVPAGDGARVTIAAPARDFPTVVTVDGKAVCGRDGAATCPASKTLRGGELTVTADVAEGQHEVRLFGAQTDPAGNLVAQERARLEFVAVKGGAYVCRASGGCRELDTGTRSDSNTPQCHLNSDCEMGQQCRFGSCVPLCREDRDCARGESCLMDAAAGWKHCVRPNED